MRRIEIRGAEPRSLRGLLAVLLLLVGSCGQAGAGQPPPRTGADILVGAPVSFTGSLQEEGTLTRQGYDMWVRWVNDHGGIDVAGVRHKVDLLMEDDQSDPGRAAALASALVMEQHVRFLLGPYGSANTGRVAAVAERDSIPMVEGNGAALATFLVGYRYVFGVLSPSDRYMTGVIDMAARFNPRPRTIALLSADDSFSEEVAQSVRSYAPQRGFQVAFDQQYTAGPATTDLSRLVDRAAAVHPDVLINSGHLMEAIAIHRAAKARNLNASIFAYSVGPATPEFVPMLGPDADYVYVGSQWTPQVRYRPQMYLTVPEYIAEYKRMFQTLDDPAYIVAQSTAAGLALQRAIENAGSLRPDRVRDALADLDVMTFFGRIKFDERGVNIYKPMVVEQIQQGRHHTVYPPDVADASPSFPTPPWNQRG